MNRIGWIALLFCLGIVDTDARQMLQEEVCNCRQNAQRTLQWGGCTYLLTDGGFFSLFGNWNADDSDKDIKERVADENEDLKEKNKKLQEENKKLKRENETYRKRLKQADDDEEDDDCNYAQTAWNIGKMGLLVAVLALGIWKLGHSRKKNPQDKHPRKCMLREMTEWLRTQKYPQPANPKGKTGGEEAAFMSGEGQSAGDCTPAGLLSGKTDESVETDTEKTEKGEKTCEQPAPKNQTDRFAHESGHWIVVGASVRGRGHVEADIPCQDSHIYADLGNGWGIAITSDGAGSAEYSHIGSKIVVKRTLHYMEQKITTSASYKNNTLPGDLEWEKLAYKVLKMVRNDMQKFAEERRIRLESLAATVIVVVHSPAGLLTVHIGDGRAGYQDMAGEWHSLTTPHKGEEANQTIFVTSDFWHIPFYEMSGVSVPETRIVREPVKSFVLMSDGCEHTSWNCNLYDAGRGIYYDPNTPYSRFFDPLVETLKEQKKNGLPLQDRETKWYNYLDKGNNSFVKETDDKTMILGTIA